MIEIQIFKGIKVAEGICKTSVLLVTTTTAKAKFSHHSFRSDDDDDVESPAINEDRTRWNSKRGQKRRKAGNHVKKNARDPLFHYHRRNSLALLEDDVVSVIH